MHFCWPTNQQEIWWGQVPGAGQVEIWERQERNMQAPCARRALPQPKPGSGSNILSHNSGCQPILHPSKPCKKFLRRLVILFYPLRWKTIVKRFSKKTTSKFLSGSSKPETRNIDKKERKLQTEDSLWLCFVRYVLSVFYLHYDYIQFDMFYSCLGFSSVLLDMFCGCSFCVSKNRRFGPARLP